jgi:mannose-6-phosphate isomerase
LIDAPAGDGARWPAGAGDGGPAGQVEGEVGVERLECPIRRYAWGSRIAIARLQHRPVPSPQPEAELWVGAHPKAPARLAGIPLHERIAADPAGTIGGEVAGRFGARLPFLLKLLAADAPLSLQVHPDQDQAAAGYAAEQARGIPADAPHRRYVDPYHKPELLVAVTGFRALCGFRDPGHTADLLGRLDVPQLAATVAALRQGDLAGAMASLLADTGSAAAAVAGVTAAAKGRGGPYELVGELASAYPGDPGVIVALLLNQVTLAPGEAIFMPAGNLHAYLHGTGVEIMATSDNVLRGGLTQKHVDVAELLRVVRFEPLDQPVITPVPVAPGVATWPVPVTEFRLHRIRLDSDVPRTEVRVPGPRVVLCLAGELRVDDGLAPMTLRAGEAGFGAPAALPLRFAGAGEGYLATTG